MDDKEALKRMLIELVKTGPEFRAAIIEALAGVFASKGDIRMLLERIAELREDFLQLQNQIAEMMRKSDERFERVMREFDGRMAEVMREFREEMRKAWEEIERRRRESQKLWEKIKELDRRVALVDRKLDALGARWGLISEEAFRSGMRAVLEDIGLKVEKWVYMDEEGYVFGHPSIVDVDVVVKDGRHVLIEIKSSVSSDDVAAFKRIRELYERAVGVRPQLMIITPFTEPKAKALADRLGIIVSSVDEETIRSKLWGEG